MEFTGERYIPSVDGPMKYEHLHRYALSLEFAAGRTVLDIASGEGYGAAILASTARFVTGVDSDPAAVAHAARSYPKPNLSFAVGLCEAAPLADASFDLVTSFETIEHHNRHEEMLGEIRRVLKPDGILIISSPNKLTYSDLPGFSNPHHVKELYYDEFVKLLFVHFKNVRFYGQRLASGSFVHPLTPASGNAWQAWSGDANHIVPQVCALKEPIYFIAVCTDREEMETPEIASVYIHRSDDIYRRAAQTSLQGGPAHGYIAMELARARTAGLRTKLTAQANYAHLFRQSLGMAKASRRHASQLREYQERLSRLMEMLELEQTKSHVTTARAELDERRATDAHLQIARQGEALRWIYDSKTWKIAAALRGLGEWPQRLRRYFRGKPFSGMLDFPQSVHGASGWLEISGWVYSTEGAISAVQLFLDEMFLGNLNYGMDRADAASTLPNDAPPSCGYHARISLQGLNLSGVRTLKVLAYDAQGNSELYTQEVHLTSSRLSECEAEIVVGDLNTPRPGFAAAQEISISGWAYSSAAPVTHVEAEIRNLRTASLVYGSARPDVTAIFPWAPLECGFTGSLSLADIPRGEYELTVRVGDARGNDRTFTRIVSVSANLSDALHGTLDFPREGFVDPDFIDIMGWACSSAGTISAVEVWLDDLYLGSISYGAPRVDVTLIFPGAPLACGFRERISLSGLSLRGDKTLNIQAYDEHGNELTLTQRITLERTAALMDFEQSEPNFKSAVNGPAAKR